MTCDGYSMYTGPGVPYWQTRSAWRMISSVCSAYSMLVLHFTEFSNGASCWMNWMRPRRTRCSVMRALAAEVDDRRVLDQRGHHRAGRQGDAGAERGDAQRRTAGHARIAFGHEPGRQLVVRRDDGPAAILGQ